MWVCANYAHLLASFRGLMETWVGSGKEITHLFFLLCHVFFTAGTPSSRITSHLETVSFCSPINLATPSLCRCCFPTPQALPRLFCPFVCGIIVWEWADSMLVTLPQERGTCMYRGYPYGLVHCSCWDNNDVQFPGGGFSAPTLCETLRVVLHVHLWLNALGRGNLPSEVQYP